MTFNPCSKQGALESLCVHACTASTWMHAYVCFTPSERRVNISMPLQGRKEISLQQVGTTKHQRHSKDLGQAASVTGLAGQTRGFKLTPGCRPLCLCWRAQLSWMWLLFTDWAISHLLCSDPGRAAACLLEFLWAAIIWKAWAPLCCHRLKTTQCHWWEGVTLSDKKGNMQGIAQHEEHPIGTLLLTVCGALWSVPLQTADF